MLHMHHYLSQIQKKMFTTLYVRPKATGKWKAQFTPLILLELYMYFYILLYFTFFLIFTWVIYFYKNWLISVNHKELNSDSLIPQ